MVPATKQEVALWTQQRVDLLKKTLAKDLTDLEFNLFLEVCKRRQLDPFAKQIYGLKRDGKLTIQTSIDGYRLIAERTGKYLGQTPPFWCGKDGKWVDIWTSPSPHNPFAAKVGVFKQGLKEPTWGIAYWEMYVASGPFWKKGGPSQLAKCAEALALKKAFPEELSGLYTNEEMEQAGPATIVTVGDVITASDEPVMLFPTSVLGSWKDGSGIQWAEAVDSDGQKWLFRGEYFQLLDTAIQDQSFLLVTFRVENNLRVVTSVVPTPLAL